MIHQNGYAYFFSQNALQPINLSQFLGSVHFLLGWVGEEGLCVCFHEQVKNKKSIKKIGANLLIFLFIFFFFSLFFFSFCCVVDYFAKYLLVHLLPLLPIRIL